MLPPARQLASLLLAAAIAGACTSGGGTTPPAGDGGNVRPSGAPPSGAPPSAKPAAGSTSPSRTGAPATAQPASPTAPVDTPRPTAVASTGPTAPAAPSSARATVPPTRTPDAIGAPVSTGVPAPTSAVARWTKLEVGGGPAPREDQTWTVDGEGRYAYLFGGRDGATVFNDLWRFDLANDAWQRLDPRNVPPARFGHTATLVPDHGLVIFGGQAEASFFNDLWAYEGDSNSWTRLPAGGATPEPRYGTCAGLAPDGRLWISHGFTDRGRFFDQRAYDFGRGAWTDVTRENPVPVIRCLHDCTWTPDGRFVLYGGQTNGVAALGDLWTRAADGNWMAQPDPPLAARQLYAITVAGGVAWIFGGANIDHRALGDLWTLDLAALAWQRVEPAGSGPVARLSATLITDPARGRLLLFGGRNSSTTFNDLWSLALPSPA